MRFLFVLIFIFSLACVKSQQNQVTVRLMFYNVENLFDIYNDSTVNDNEFLPQGKKYWNQKKYQQKIENLTSVIASIGEWEMPAIVGLCEIENIDVLNDLFLKSSLSKYSYNIVHYNSPDPRGIDVAMAYRSDIFRLLCSQAIRIRYDESNQKTTRDILYCKGIIGTHDTLHLFVNHWPSRIGGQEADIKRHKVAFVLREKVDSLLQTNIHSKILIMGDLNDEPDDETVLSTLGAKPIQQKEDKATLYNLASGYLSTHHYGSHKYRGQWSVFDHIIVSTAMLASTSNFTIYKSDFIVKPDTRNMGFTPFRTYNGMKYEGGYSDHLPVFVDYTIEK